LVSWDISWHDGQAVVLLSGDLDFDSDTELREAIDPLLQGDRVPAEILLDLSEVQFIDSGGIRALIVSHGEAKTRGVRLRVQNPQPTPARVLQITQVDRLLGLHLPDEGSRPRRWADGIVPHPPGAPRPPVGPAGLVRSPAGTTEGMHPETPERPGMPTQPLPIAQVSVGMTVVDAAGEQVGTVSAVQMAGTDVRPEAPPGVADNLMAAGYLLVDGTGVLATDVYVAGQDVAQVTEGDTGVVQLNVLREALQRAG